MCCKVFEDDTGGPYGIWIRVLWSRHAYIRSVQIGPVDWPQPVGGNGPVKSPVPYRDWSRPR